MITPEYLEDRITEFIAAREKCQADIAANNGAIQVCRHLLDQLAVEDVVEIDTSDLSLPVLDKSADKAEEAKANGEAAAS